MSKYIAQPKDRLGSRKGTYSSKVNEVMTEKPKTAEEIAQECGLPIRRVLARLYAGCEKGVFVREKNIRFSLSPGKVSK